MQRPQLEHVIRAAAGITGTAEIVVIGSQSLLAQFPAPPPKLLVSMEADVFTLRSAEDADLIDGSIGEGSPFHQTFGYYAHGVSVETAILPHNTMPSEAITATRLFRSVISRPHNSESRTQPINL
jgi:hypothetical protein